MLAYVLPMLTTLLLADDMNRSLGTKFGGGPGLKSEYGVKS